VNVNGLTRSFTVNPEQPSPTGPSTEMIGVAAIAVVIAAIVAVYFTKMKK